MSRYVLSEKGREAIRKRARHEGRGLVKTKLQREEELNTGAPLPQAFYWDREKLYCSKHKKPLEYQGPGAAAGEFRFLCRKCCETFYVSLSALQRLTPQEAQGRSDA